MDLQDATAILARTPLVLEALLGDLSAEQVMRTDGPDTWSSHDIVGHLLAGEIEDWVPRAQIIIKHGTDQTFEPFDRSAMRTTATDSPAALLGRFQTARTTSLATLTAMQLTASDLKREGRHPELGVVTLGQLVAAWVAHDLTHLAQIGEVLARAYIADVGPWRQYLPALDRVASSE
ncbi:MAG TPA: DinB family protein [Acidothermaceae bacterium]|jgi:hypothetical protein